MVKGWLRARYTASVAVTMIAAVLVAVPVDGRAATPRAVPTAACPATEVPRDVNDDGNQDELVGIPAAHAVDVIGTGEDVGLLGSQLPAASGLGNAVDYADVNGDGCADLILGEPGTSTSHGAVSIVFGPVGTHAAAAVTLTAPDAVNGDEFGAAVALTDYNNTFVRASDLWVGAPGHAVDGHADAGVLYHYRFTSAGVPQLLQEMTEARAVIPGSANAGDRFGAVLSPSSYFGPGVTVGIPDKSFYGLASAGQVDRINVDSSDLLTTSYAYNQTSPGVAGASAAGNRFGASLSAGGWAVGIPNAPVGSALQAGAVAVFADGDRYGDTLKPVGYYTENSPGIPGTSERGDHFGASVALSTFQCQEHNDIAVGAPGEDLGTAANAGSVTMITEPSDDDPPGHPLCPARLLYQGHGLPGTLQTNADLGAALGIIPGEPGLDEDYFAILQIGVPGENTSGLTAAGVEYTWNIRGSDFTTLGSTGPFANERFGSVYPPS